MIPALTKKKVYETINATILQGLKPMQIVREIQTITGLSERQSHKYYSTVKNEMVKQLEKERPYFVEEAIRIKKQLFSEAYSDRDLRLANEINNDENRIKGIYSPIQQSGDTSTPPLTINIQVVNS
jgi:phosphate-selective porin